MLLTCMLDHTSLVELIDHMKDEEPRKLNLFARDGRLTTMLDGESGVEIEILMPIGIRSFQRFSASKYRSNLTDDFAFTPSMDGDCFVYPGQCYIEVNPDGSYHLTLANEQYKGYCLEKLELILYINHYLKECVS